MTTAWTALGDLLRDADEHGDFTGDSDHPIHQVVNKLCSAKLYKEILIAALDQPLEVRDREMVVRALSEKGMNEAIPTLFRLFESETTTDSSLLWAVGNAIYTVASKEYLPDTLRACRDQSLGSSRQMLVIHASRFKNKAEVLDTLISLLDDSTVRGHALEALWRFGDTRALPAIKATLVRKNLYEAKAKKTAISRLERKLNKTKIKQGGTREPATRSNSRD